MLKVGTRLRPAQLGVLASLGQRDVRYFRRPCVSVIATGDELVEPGVALTPGSIYNSSAYSIPALARQADAELGTTATVPDDLIRIRDQVEAAISSSDVVVICGGVSVGVHDHVRQSLAELGVRQCFSGVALKPGKPMWFGTRGETLVFRATRQPRFYDGDVRALRRPRTTGSQRRHWRTPEVDRDAGQRLHKATGARTRRPVPPRATRVRVVRDAHWRSGLSRLDLDARGGRASYRPERQQCGESR